MDKIRFLALGGLDEDGKNMSVIEINDEIYVVDAGLKYPQTDQLGVEIVIPDLSYLKKNKKRVKAIFITHGHDDVMGALPYLVKEVNAPVYATPLIALMIEDLFKENKVKNANIHKIKRNSRFKVGERRFVAFGLTHSIPDTFGIAIDTDQGYIVHSSEFIIDFDVRNQGFMCDVANISELGKKGVFLLTAESVASKRQGFTSPNHRITKRIERVFEETDDRILVTLYEQNIYRLIEVIETAHKFKRKVFFYGEKQRRLMKHLERLNYYHMPKGLEIKPDQFNNEIKDVVVIVSDIGPSVFSKMGRIAMGEDQLVEVNEKDNVIVASPVVPGTEAIAGAMINELYKDGVKVTSLNYKDVMPMHASVEDLKMMIALLKPKYYVPVKGEYQNLVANASVAVDMGISAGNIVVLDNGQVAEFVDGRLKTTSEILKLEDMLIDGKDHLDTSGLVLRDRQTLATDGSIIVGMVINNKTKEILGGPDVQSRGVIYLKDADNIMKEVGVILEQTILKLVEKHKYDNVTARNEARDVIAKYIYKQTGKRPMILPVIIEIHI
ncbi:ribonuclease J [Erysipelothrix tonsillarum]|uniref:ribonuclease J n=1 Tax=Erysipelothrix tonsillarum TaxID=38402 RepID=UPI000375F156|nr:ribonuclease J [Erysipelothrix tonsillarum]